MDNLKNILDYIMPLATFILSITSILIAVKSWKLSQGEIEFQIANIIRESQYRVSDSATELAKYRQEFLSEREDGQTEENRLEMLYDDLVYKTLDDKFEQSVEIMLNSYEESCAKYLDKKVDAERFKKSYHRSIRRIVEDDEMESEFNTPTSAYKCILKVYNEWYNLEQ